MLVAIYARTSTLEQQQGRTIESQLDELRDFCREKQYRVFREYIDDGYSGSILERPGLDALRDDARNKQFEGVVIHHPDRLSRTQLHQILLYNEFERLRTHIDFVKYPDFFEGSEESKVINKSVWSMVSELERLRIRERTRRGRRSKARKGRVVGNIPPYGYSYNKEKGTYEVIESEATVVRMIFEWVKDGWSIREVVRKLTELEIPTTHGSSKWARSTVSKILGREIYSNGLTYYNKYESVEPQKVLKYSTYKRTQKSSRALRGKDEWIPIQLPDACKIIDQTLYDQVQVQIKRNASFSPRNTKHDYLLRGLIVCKRCGSPYYADSCHGRAIYRCGSKNLVFPSHPTCSAGSVSAEVIEPFVMDKLTNELLNPKLVLVQARRYEEKMKHNAKLRDLSISAQRLEEIEVEEQRLIKAYQSGVVDISQLEAALGGVKLEKTILQRKLEEKPAEPLRFTRYSANVLCRKLRRLIMKLEWKKKQLVMQKLIEKIEYNVTTRSVDIVMALKAPRRIL